MDWKPPSSFTAHSSYSLSMFPENSELLWLVETDAVHRFLLHDPLFLLLDLSSSFWQCSYCIGKGYVASNTKSKQTVLQSDSCNLMLRYCSQTNLPPNLKALLPAQLVPFAMPPQLFSFRSLFQIVLWP